MPAYDFEATLAGMLFRETGCLAFRQALRESWGQRRAGHEEQSWGVRCLCCLGVSPGLMGRGRR
eukprot:2362814-Alexandrium_andersonii.AAC.1